MRNDFCSGYLMHHGIQGQKWGVKNGPPYPLKDSQKSSVEKKSFQLTDNQKKCIAIGAASAATILAAYGVYKLGGPKSVAKLTEIGARTASSYLDMDLQFFAKKAKKEFRFKSKEEYARVMHVFNSVPRKLKTEPYLMRKIQSDDGPGGGAYFYYATNMDGYGDFKVTKRVKISESGTGLLERGKYVEWK